MPSGTESERDGEIVESLFPDFGRFQSFRVRRTDGANILTPAAFNDALALRDGGQAVTWANEVQARPARVRPAVRLRPLTHERGPLL